MVVDDDLKELRDSKGKHTRILTDMCKFYRDWHVKSDGVYGKLHCFCLFVCLFSPRVVPVLSLHTNFDWCNGSHFVQLRLQAYFFMTQSALSHL